MQFKLSRFLAVIIVGIAIGAISELGDQGFLSGGESISGADTTARLDPGSQDFVLAVSWQPAFCETRPRRPECRSQRVERMDARQFSLHGLWPEPRHETHCGVPDAVEGQDRAGRWRNLPKLALSAQTRRALEEAMPGIQSFLHRHEWIKHGTCVRGADPQTYYNASLSMLRALNDSALATLFVANINGRVSMHDAEAALISSFGTRARGKIGLDCVRDGERTLIQEVRISLTGRIADAVDFASMLNGSPEIRRGCSVGLIDPAGLQ